MSDKPRMYATALPDGVPEDTTRCIQTVCSSSAWDGGHQCKRNRGHGPGGLWCKQHGLRVEEREARWLERERERHLAEFANRQAFDSLAKERDASEEGVK